MTIYSSHSIGHIALVAVFTLYMFYLGFTAQKVYRDYSPACRVMHGASVILCAMGAIAACATM